MSTRVQWLPTSDTANYRLETAALVAGPWTTVTTIAHNLVGPDYDVATGVFFYIHSAGTALTYYRLISIDALLNESAPSAAFRVGQLAENLTSLSNVRTYLGLKATETASDDLLNRLISAASVWFQNQTDNPILPATYTELADGDGTRFLPLPNGPVTAITSVTVNYEVIPERTSTTDGWFLRSDCLYLTSGLRFTKGLGNVEVVYTAGYNIVPPDVEQAVIELVASRFKERDHVGQTASTVSNGANVTFTTFSAPASVMLTIDAYRRVKV